MSACIPTPEQREAVLLDLVRKFAGEASTSRTAAKSTAEIEAEVLAVIDDEIGRVCAEWSPEGRENRVAQRIHVGLRLAIRSHFAGEDP